MKQLIIGLMLVGLFGCASNVIPMGPDTFMLEDTGAWSWSSGNAMKGGLYQKANDFCATRGQHLMPIDAKSNNSCMSYNCPFAHAEISFRCLPGTDAELRRPQVKPDATIRIE
jgi:hypothetical protein